MNDETLNNLLTKANEYINTGNFEEAETLANELLAELEKIGESTDTVTARQRDTTHCEALRTLSIEKWRRVDYYPALTHARAAIDLAKEKNLDGDTYAKVLGNIGIVYQYLSEYPQALTYLQKALAINEESGSKNGIANNLGTIGIVYSNLSDYRQALSYYQKALAIYEEIGSKNGIASNLTNIGLVYWNLSDYPQALTYLQKSLAISEEIGSKNGIASNLGNIGLVYRNLSDYPQALTYYQKSLAIYEEIGSKDGIAFNLGNIGTLYWNLSDYSEALTYFQKSLAIKEEIGSKEGIANNLGNIGVLYANKEFDGYDTDKAEESFLTAIALLEDIGEKRYLYDVRKSLADLYETQERWKEHSIQFKKYHTLKEEVQSEEMLHFFFYNRFCFCYFHQF